jgi:hypothetical protein
MNNRNLIAVFVVVFLLTVTLTSWRDGRLSAHAMFPIRNAFTGASTADAGSARAFDASLPADVPDMSSVARPRNSTLPFGSDETTADAPYPVDDAGPPSMLDPASTEVPVLLTVDNSPGSTRRTATIRNVGSEVLNVKVTSVNPPAGSRSVVQVAVPPRAELNLTEAGLVVATGAEMSIESPPYLAQKSTVY